MRVADYIFKYFADHGVKHVFLVTGGGAMHLNDALKKEARIKYICTHHEQGAAVAAEGYARTCGALAVVNVTSGPGGTNAITGVIGQWLDSVPVLYLSGQVKFETTISSAPGSGLRQLGDQEINIVDIVKPITKYAKMVTNSATIKAELDKAVHIATSGRPGPVWLDIPLNIQGAIIDENELKSVTLQPEIIGIKEGQTASIVKELQQAERPVVVAGHGIRLGKARELFERLLEKTGLPVLSTFNGFDLMPTASDSFIGRIGTLGSRGGNFALQNADLVIFLGTRNNIRQISYNWGSFARHAKKIIVDIDQAELHKATVKGDMLIYADVYDFLVSLLKVLPDNYRVAPEWHKWCLDRKKKYPIVLEEYREHNKGTVHPYFFVEEFTKQLPDDAVMVAGNGTACVVLFQAGIVKEKQRIFWNSGCASMGYALPASIGAAVASGRDVICLTGDGSIQMNLQELQTIKKNQLPVKIIILNNQGYSSIKQTQTSFFNANYIGCDEASGVSFPNNEKLAGLYDFPYCRIDSGNTMHGVIKQILDTKGPLICEVMLPTDYSFAPKLSSEKKPDGRIISKPLEDLFPFLDREEFDSNMIFKNP